MRTRSRGMSLLEVLVASLVIGIVVVPVFTSIQTGHQESGRIAEETVAANLGSSLLERLARVPYSRLPVIGPDTLDLSVGRFFTDAAYAPVIEPYPGEYLRQVTIEEVSQRLDAPTAPANSRWGNLKLITVKVTWRPDYLRQRSERTLTFSTLVTDDTEAE